MESGKNVKVKKGVASKDTNNRTEKITTGPAVCCGGNKPETVPAVGRGEGALTVNDPDLSVADN